MKREDIEKAVDGLFEHRSTYTMSKHKVDDFVIEQVNAALDEAMQKLIEHVDDNLIAENVMRGVLSRLKINRDT